MWRTHTHIFLRTDNIVLLVEIVCDHNNLLLYQVYNKIKEGIPVRWILILNR